MRGAGAGQSRIVAWIGLAVVVGCVPVEGDGDVVATREPAAEVPAPMAADGPALRLLNTLAVKGRAPRTGYAREQFGRAWIDTDHNGCDTRDDILRRDLRDASFKPGGRACVVLSGVLDDPYTGAQIRFEHGVTGVDIDHVVALGDAWVKGASHWQPGMRLALANDPLNLLAVDASANRAKGDGDAATWLPPARGYRCKYVARQVAVKAKYGLAVTAAERDAMRKILEECPDEPAPVGDAPTVATAPRDEPRSARTPPARPTAEPAPRAARGDPNYGTCKQAKAHGAGPYRRDQDPEYHYYRDQDGDGVVCE